MWWLAGTRIPASLAWGWPTRLVMAVHYTNRCIAFPGDVRERPDLPLIGEVPMPIKLIARILGLWKPHELPAPSSGRIHDVAYDLRPLPRGMVSISMYLPRDRMVIEPTCVRVSEGEDVCFTIDLSHAKGAELIETGLEFLTDDYEYLRELNHFERLDLQYADITDAVLEYVGRIRSLRCINLNYTDVTDTGLEHLNGLRSLQEL